MAFLTAPLTARKAPTIDAPVLRPVTTSEDFVARIIPDSMLPSSSATDSATGAVDITRVDSIHVAGGSDSETSSPRAAMESCGANATGTSVAGRTAATVGLTSSLGSPNTGAEVSGMNVARLTAGASITR